MERHCHGHQSSQALQIALVNRAATTPGHALTQHLNDKMTKDDEGCRRAAQCHDGSDVGRQSTPIKSIETEIQRNKRKSIKLLY